MYVKAILNHKLPVSHQEMERTITVTRDFADPNQRIMIYVRSI
ncbi:hypothetical protein DB29_02712 [Shouchella clausii]|nr:hypothetical protein DB29_02712 [Shouchella clausii]